MQATVHPAADTAMELQESTLVDTFTPTARDDETPPLKKMRCEPHPILDNEQLRRRTAFVPKNMPTILRLPSGVMKQVVLEPGQIVSIGKFGAFQAEDIIGRAFGPTYEIKADNKVEILRRAAAEALVESEATNENIYDDGESQLLSYEDIKAMKEAGATGREIIQRQLEANKSYDQRTVYSQSKIMKRKEAKHLQFFTPLAPDMYNVCAYNFERNPDKIRGMRPDALSQVLSFGNVQAGGRFLVVDGIGGLLTGAVLERMGGCGSVHMIHDADSPPSLELMPQFNLTPMHVDRVLPAHMADELKKEYKTDRERNRARKKRAGIEDFIATRQQLFDGQFDGLLVASPYEPYSIIHRLAPYLAGSANIVVHSPYLQPLAEVQARLRAEHTYVNVLVTEPWLRRYQVLPARTHPDMTTSANAGYILHAIRILSPDEPLAGPPQ
ncbi:Trm6p [Malassezia vespertilionis]|uniref:tRNA (adenine(58)-N(1))-methyltransferase non-catalytic subunit TRM6 n=1 Tax=Malassezia vespertilionis TaxID=2020962 RepID=A0A2N1J8E0_9BASI|nr:Trm6p [Malassezia vespertilionis]